MTNIQAIELLKGLEQSLDDYCELNDEGKNAFRMAITALEVFGNSEQLPSAQPERKPGEWILSDAQNPEDVRNGNYTYTCSNCLYSDIHAKTAVVPFCWHCGADMRGEQDEKR